MSGEVKGNSGPAEISAALGPPGDPPEGRNVFAEDISLLKTTAESALEATRLPPTRVLNLIGIDPGRSYRRVRVEVLQAITPTVWGPGVLPSFSTSPTAAGVSV